MRPIAGACQREMRLRICYRDTLVLGESEKVDLWDEPPQPLRWATVVRVPGCATRAQCAQHKATTDTKFLQLEKDTYFYLLRFSALRYWGNHRSRDVSMCAERGPGTSRSWAAKNYS
jgi:hypothetical protein